MDDYKNLAEFALDCAQSSGRRCEYAEVRLDSNSTETITFINGKLHIGNLPIDLTSDAFARKTGLNIRLLVDGGMGMATTNQLTKESVINEVEYAYRSARRSSKQRKIPIKMSEEKVYETEWQSKYKINPMDVYLKKNFLLNLYIFLYY
jgi:TldD protein